MYPVLKSDVRLKKVGKFCWLYASTLSIDSPVPQYVAFVLTLMDGRWSVDELSIILCTTYKSEKDFCVKLVGDILKQYDACIEFYDDGRFVKQRYDPSDFLFNGSFDDDFKIERIESPNILGVSLTGACNFKCIYCFNASEKRRNNELNGDEWCDVIEQAEHFGVFQVIVTGGEPTMHPQLPQILRKIKSSDMDFKFFTNGGYLTDEICELLKGSPVQVSLDAADRNTHLKLTGFDTFETVKANIRRLVGLCPDVTIKAVITSENYSECAALYELCKNLGVSSLGLEEFDVSSSGRGGVDLRITDLQKAEIRKVCSKLEASETKLNFGFRKSEWTDATDIIRCGAFCNAMIISPCGDLIGCEKMIDVPAMKIGNVREHTLVELWNSPRIDEFLHNVRNTKDTKCGKCGVFDYCRSGCFATKHYFDKPIFGADPRCAIC